MRISQLERLVLELTKHVSPEFEVRFRPGIVLIIEELKRRHPDV